jgi:glycosyltransferase involved in cell wall biosynthesis
MTHYNKIAIFLATSGHSGVDRIAKNLIPEFLARGYQVDLLQIENHGPYLEIDHPNLQIKPLGSHHVYTSLLSLSRYLRRQRPSVLLCDKDKVNRTAILAKLLSLTRTPVVVRLGTTVSINLQHRNIVDRVLQKLSFRYLYRLAARVITPSQGVASDLQGLAHLPKGKIAVVPSPILGDELYSLARQPVIHPWLAYKKHPVILGVGELSARKDFATLIRAFAKLREKLDARLVIVGKGRKRDELLQLAEELKIKDDVDLPGFCKNPYPYFAHADVFVLSSRWEGLGIVIVEALGLGTPVIASDCPSGPAEILQDGKIGPLFKVGDADALASELDKLLNRPPVEETLKQAVRDYRIEHSATRYLQALGLRARL